MAMRVKAPAMRREAPLTDSGLRDFWRLCKPNVMQLVIFTSAVAMFVAPGSVHPLLDFTALLAIALGAAASAAINNSFDADIDKRMARTRLRPTASGRIEPADALAVVLRLRARLGVGAQARGALDVGPQHLGEP